MRVVDGHEQRERLRARLGIAQKVYGVLLGRRVMGLEVAPVPSGDRILPVAEMPLPEVAGAVACGAQLHGEGRLCQRAPPRRPDVAHDPRRTRVESGQERRAAGRALRGRAEGTLEYQAFFRQHIKVGRIEERVHETHRLPVLLIGEDEEDVGLGLLLSQRLRG